MRERNKYLYMILSESRIRVYDRNLITDIFNGFKQALHELRSDISDYQLALWVIQSQLKLDLPRYKPNQIDFIIDKANESLRQDLHIMSFLTSVYEMCVKEQINSQMMFLEDFYNKLNTKTLDISYPLGIFSTKANANSQMVTQSPLLAGIISLETKGDRVKFELKLGKKAPNRQVFIVHTASQFAEKVVDAIARYNSDFLDEVLHSEMFTSCHNFNPKFRDPRFHVTTFKEKKALDGIVKWDITNEKNLKHVPNLIKAGGRTVLKLRIIYAVDPRHELMDTNYYAYYDTDLRLICLNLNVSDYNSNWHNTIEHELIHFMQYRYNVGWPSNKVLTYSDNPEELDKYENQAEEYWPLFTSNVKGTIDELQDNGYPKADAIAYIGNKLVRMFQQGVISQNVFKGYIKEALKYIDSDYIEP